MYRMLVIGLLVAAAVACSGRPPESAWLKQTPEHLKKVEIEGEAARIDERSRTVYVEDCEIARKVTASGGKYGPKDEQDAYGFVCRT
jgi:hypothetical protein